METRYEQGTRYEDGVTVAFAAKPKGLPAELADVIIMVSIIAGKHNIDLDQAISEKFAELDLRLTQKLERKLA
jgi:NTP pyrophosphatase (non-canonical NTP hydrolase)